MRASGEIPLCHTTIEIRSFTWYNFYMKKTITTEVKLTNEDVEDAVRAYLKENFNFDAETIKFNTRIKETSDQFDRYLTRDAVLEGVTCTVIQESK